ncbi:saccharopine dehydrogenase NADP-binding domain-containing protein [Candidatus Woesearchaeota archaeon]|nr:saccharopine dehydrogenase NADP-binding domain-containing protein [Candidatus Woesearchaeota archaeon]
MAYDFIVIGATGMQGKIVSRSLLEQGYSVLLCGRDKKRVEHLLGRKADFAFIELRQTRKALQTLRKANPAIILNCAEGDFNLAVQRLSLQLGAHYLDMGSEIEMTSRQFALDTAFKGKKILALTGCGSVPGIGNIMLAFARKKMTTILSVDVGFAWSANMDVFVAPFSIQSIIEEFTDRPTVVENGRFVKKAPLYGLKEVSVDGIGKQQFFLVRHPEVYTFKQYLKEAKNIRFFAGFPLYSYDQIKSFINLGFASHDDITVEGKTVKPIYYLREVLKHAKVPDEYREKESLWLHLEGDQKHSMTCVVDTLPGWEDAGCNIDTGLPMAIMAAMIKKGVITATGSSSPEFVVPPEPFFAELAKYKMYVYDNGKRVN